MRLLSKLLSKPYLPKFKPTRVLKTSGYILGAAGLGMGAGYAERGLTNAGNYFSEYINKHKKLDAFEYNMSLGFLSFGAATERQQLLRNLNESENGPRSVLGKEASLYSSFI